MFLWTLWTQFILYWFYYPIQTVDAFGGLELNSIPTVIYDGLKCTFAIPSKLPNSTASEDDAIPVCDWRTPVISAGVSSRFR